MSDHGIFEPLFDPNITSDEVIDRLEKEGDEAVERHLGRAASSHKLLVERFVEEWPDTVKWLRTSAKTAVAGYVLGALITTEDRLLRLTGKVIDATHKAQLDRRAAAQRMGQHAPRPAVHVVGKYLNPVFAKLAQWRDSIGEPE